MPSAEGHKAAALERGSTNLFRKRPDRKYSNPLVLTGGSVFSQETWQCLDTLVGVTNERCHWHLERQGRGCCSSLHCSGEPSWHKEDQQCRNGDPVHGRHIGSSVSAPLPRLGYKNRPQAITCWPLLYSVSKVHKDHTLAGCQGSDATQTTH